MADVAILGAGGMGREAAAWVAASGRAPVGFLDDDAALIGRQLAGLPVLGGREWLDDHPDTTVVVAVGAPATRQRLVAGLTAAGVRLHTLVHPSASVGPRVELGAGVIVGPGTVLTCDVTVGAGTIVNYGAMVGHDGRIGAACFLAPSACLAGTVTLGERVEVGLGARIIQGVTVDDDAVVGAGAVVVRDVAGDATVVGVPARPLPQASPAP